METETDLGGAAIRTAFDTVSDNTQDLMYDILPYALGVMAASWGIKKAVGFFKGTAR